MCKMKGPIYENRSIMQICGGARKPRQWKKNNFATGKSDKHALRWSVLAALRANSLRAVFCSK